MLSSNPWKYKMVGINLDKLENINKSHQWNNLAYLNDSNGHSHVPSAAQLNGDTDAANFRWQTWATLYVWKGGRRKLELAISHFFTIPKGFPMFSGLSTWMEIMTLWTSAGKHGQPSTSGTASMEIGTCDISLVDCDIFTIPRGFLMFSGKPTQMETLTLRTSIGRHGQPSASGKVVEGNWNLWYLTGGFWYFHNSSGVSYVFRAVHLNGDTDAMNFRWQTWATLYVWKGGRRKLELAISHWWIVRYWRYELPLADMGNLVWLERWSKETGTCDISLVHCDILIISKTNVTFSGLLSLTHTLTL